MRLRVAIAPTIAAVLAGPLLVEAQQPERPKLVIAMAVDQLRGDLLDHYADAFEGGLKRLMDEGFRFRQASHAHARTSTAPGHATLATGVFPSRHAVVANSWRQRHGDTWVPTYAVEDAENRILGFENERALQGRSPRTMLREGLADWFAEADDGSRRVSISKKDRAAIPMGGLHSEHVYWMVPEIGQFVTSRYYMNRYPGWVRDFNREVMPGITEGREWTSLVPERHTHLARPDSADYEGYTGISTFPHVSELENPPDSPQDHAAWVYDQPRADQAVLEFTKAAILELDLGQRDEQDFLAVALSATDRVGHPYGPFSQEQFSNLIHLDRALGDFLDFLDEEIGEGGWVLGFAGDHGVVTPPEAQVQLGTNPEAKRILLDELLPRLSAAVTEAGSAGPHPEDVAARLAELVEARGLVEKAYTHYELTRGEPADSFAVLFRNSYYPGRAWGTLSHLGVEIRERDGDLLAYGARGTNHESTYWYDRWVEMAFLGAGVEPGWTDRAVYTVDFAPSLAALAGIVVPDDLDGRNIW